MKNYHHDQLPPAQKDLLTDKHFGDLVRAVSAIKTKIKEDSKKMSRMNLEIFDVKTKVSALVLKYENGTLEGENQLSLGQEELIVAHDFAIKTIIDQVIALNETTRKVCMITG